MSIMAISAASGSSCKEIVMVCEVGFGERTKDSSFSKLFIPMN